MTDPLEQAMFRDVRWCTLLSVACALTGAVWKRATAAAPPAIAPTIVVAPTEPIDAIAVASPARDEGPPAPTSEVLFVFRAGGEAYVALGAAREGQPHGATRLVHDDYVDAAVAPLAARELPRVARGWRGREVRVDGTCSAKLEHFALVARLVGDPSYAGLDREHWTASDVLDKGTAVIAAKLDGCTGTYARAATAPPIYAYEHEVDTELESAARELLLASEPARVVQAEAASTTISTETLHDARTGTRWVSVRAHADYECGAPEVNVWGLFRVGADRHLTPIELRGLGELDAISQVLDVDGDGVPEILGTSWLNTATLLTDAAGHAGRLDMPFFSCPC